MFIFLKFEIKAGSKLKRASSYYVIDPKVHWLNAIKPRCNGNIGWLKCQPLMLLSMEGIDVSEMIFQSETLFVNLSSQC